MSELIKLPNIGKELDRQLNEVMNLTTIVSLPDVYLKHSMKKTRKIRTIISIL